MGLKRFLKGISLEKTSVFSIFQFEIFRTIFIKPYFSFLNFNDKSNFNKYFFEKLFIKLYTLKTWNEQFKHEEKNKLFYLIKKGFNNPYLRINKLTIN